MPPSLLPSDDLQTKNLPIEIVESGTVIYRSHRNASSPIYYSVGHPGNRFGDPAAKFGVCYCAQAPAGAFVETFLRQGTGGFVDPDELRKRSIADIEVLQELRLVACYGAGLHKLGATAAITAHDDIGPAQAWAAAIYHHPDAPDGIRYRVRHDNDQIGVALFDRSGPALSWVSSEVWRHSPHLNGICNRYELIL